ncbi:MAG: hypothetical protein AAGA92_10695 [Planctomycetota bacterium]
MQIELGGMLDMLRVLQDAKVQQELQLKPEQSGRLRPLIGLLRERFGGEILNLIDQTGGSESATVEGAAEPGVDGAGPLGGVDAQALLTDVLQDEQIQRLREILLQMKLRRSGAPAALSSNELARALDLTREQQDELRERGRAAADRTEEQMQAAMSEQRASVQDVLTPEQTEKLDVLLGEEFDLPSALLDAEEPPAASRRRERERQGLIRRLRDRREEARPAESE